jgi:oligopeptide/dipeptide ABC transporter ATP-binding protein
MTPILSTHNVSKLFPLKRGLLSRDRRYVHAVDGVSIDIFEKDTLALVGESGSGKSTLGQLLLGLHQPSDGTVIWSGLPLTSLTPDQERQFRRDVQVVFQDPYGSLNPRMTVRSIIGRPLKLHRLAGPADIDREVRRLLELVGLSPASAYIDRFPHEFSGGQRQRIAIGRALALNPRVIVADEPVSALDVSVRAQILMLLSALRREFGLSMLFTTHDLGVVRYIADRIAVMYLGKIVEIAPSDTFFRATHHPYSRMLLGSALSSNPEVGLAARKSSVQGEPPSPINPPSGCRFRTRCSFAHARCEREEPVLRSVGPEHSSACHLDQFESRRPDAQSFQAHTAHPPC